MKNQRSNDKQNSRFITSRGVAVRSLFLSIAAILTCFLYTNCGGFASGAAAGGNLNGSTSVPAAAGQINVLAVTIGCGYVNEPCVSVTVCIPGTMNCQTINNILLDTGSYGLRLFQNTSSDSFQTASTTLLGLPLEADPSNAANVYSECVHYADGSSDWGPVAMADVQMGSETAPNVPIQIINSTFASIPSSCTSPDVSPVTTGFNGILGVGLFVQDCGAACAPTTGDLSQPIYYSCPATGSGACNAGSLVALTQQVSNPVSYLPADNNGVVLQLPNIAGSGALSDSGFLIFGIGTQPNNTPVGTTTLTASSDVGEISTVFNGVTESQSFIDSGSNGLYFDGTSATPECGDSSFFCPGSSVSLTATPQGQDGTQITVPFAIDNADNMLSESNPDLAFPQLGGSMPGAFDWGLPFFFGRSVFVQLEQTSTALGAGPLWAF